MDTHSRSRANGTPSIDSVQSYRVRLQRLNGIEDSKNALIEVSSAHLPLSGIL